MEIDIEEQDVTIKTQIVEIDEQLILNDLSNEEIFDKSNITSVECREHFGEDALLETILLSDAISHYGEDVVLNEIGKEAAIQHFGIDVAE